MLISYLCFVFMFMIYIVYLIVILSKCLCRSCICHFYNVWQKDQSTDHGNWRLFHNPGSSLEKKHPVWEQQDQDNWVRDTWDWLNALCPFEDFIWMRLLLEPSPILLAPFQMSFWRIALMSTSSAPQGIPLQITASPWTSPSLSPLP